MEIELGDLDQTTLVYLLESCGSIHESVETLTKRQPMHNGKETKSYRIKAAMSEFCRQRNIRECWASRLSYKLMAHKSKLVDTFTSVDLLECLLVLDVAVFCTLSGQHAAFRPVLKMIQTKGLFKLRQ